MSDKVHIHKFLRPFLVLWPYFHILRTWYFESLEDQSTYQVVPHADAAKQLTVTSLIL